MLEHEDLIFQAFDEVQAFDTLKVGDVVGYRQDHTCYSLEGIVDNVGICGLPDGTTREIPLAELANVEKVFVRFLMLVGKTIVVKV